MKWHQDEEFVTWVREVHYSTLTDMQWTSVMEVNRALPLWLVYYDQCEKMYTAWCVKGKMTKFDVEDTVEGCRWCPFNHAGDMDPSRCTYPKPDKGIDEGTNGFGSANRVPKKCPLRVGSALVKLKEVKDA